MRELTIKRCNKCGALIHIIEDCDCDNCGITCCNQKMAKLNSNSTDASFEKHLPTYEIDNDKIIVKVDHVMDEEHYIKFISLVTDTKEEIVYLNPNEKAEVVFDYVQDSCLYSYCNKHGLWKTEVK